MSAGQSMSQVKAEGSTRHPEVLQHIANCTPAAHMHGKAQTAQQLLLKASVLVASVHVACNILEGVIMCDSELCLNSPPPAQLGTWVLCLRQALGLTSPAGCMESGDTATDSHLQRQVQGASKPP